MTAAAWIGSLAGVAAVVIGWLAYRHQTRKPADQGATLSARFEKEGSSDLLVVSNQGPGPAQLKSVEPLNNPNLLLGPLSFDDLELLKGEEYRIPAAPALGMSLPVKIRMTWVDSRGEQSRDQILNL
jgi:hypothetical protein